jgi:hypothetical protein
MDIPNDILNIILKYANNKNCILVCKLWHYIILKSSITCKYCNKFTKIYDDDVKIIDDKICHSPYDAIIKIPVKDFKNMMYFVGDRLGSIKGVYVSCSRNKFKISVENFSIRSTFSFRTPINISHMNEIDDKTPKVISGYCRHQDLLNICTYSKINNTVKINMKYVKFFENKNIVIEEV